jgi:hypothetical protein
MTTWARVNALKRRCEPAAGKSAIDVVNREAVIGSL